MAAITVRVLAGIMAALPPDAVVVLAKDSEGNAFSPMQHAESWSVGRYVAHRPWHGEFCDETSDDGGAQTGGVPAVCLWPTN